MPLWRIVGSFSAAVLIGATAREPVAFMRSAPAIATFRVGEETFRVKLTTEAQAQAAQSAMAGGSARIPNGRIVAGTEVNTGWHWHLEDVEFAEMAMELCDGRPSDVEKAGVEFGGGRFCPWRATVVRVE